jgi:hypothetical protein
MATEAPAHSILRGIGLLARFSRDGFAQFGDTPQAFVNSLAPMLALPLAFAVPSLLGGAGFGAMADILASVVALLAPAVLSHTLARLWGREALWLRYIVAFNWMQAAFTLAMIIALYAFTSSLAGGLRDLSAVLLPSLSFTIYWLTLYWFLTRNGLQLSRLRTTLAVVALNFVTGMLVLGPRLLAWAPAGTPGP